MEVKGAEVDVQRMGGQGGAGVKGLRSRLPWSWGGKVKWVELDGLT